MKVQRLRATYARGETLRYVSHLDLVRAWERILRRACIPVAYSEGFSPRPQVQFVAPLPLGALADAEVMDVYLSAPVPAETFTKAVVGSMPPGLRLIDVYDVPLAGTSLQSELRAADWRVVLPPEIERTCVEEAVSSFLARSTVPWEQVREGGAVRKYDLRPLVKTLQIEPDGPPMSLFMRLRAEPGATGRADHVAAALGFTAPARLIRARIILAGEQ